MEPVKVSEQDLAVINNYLKDQFGVDTVTGQPIWRVVWSNDQYEKRLTEYTDAGILLLQPEVRLLPKYSQWIIHKYVLERLVVVPHFQADELPTAKVSYEPIWTFEDKNGDYLPPRIDASKFVIDTIYAAQFGPKTHSLSKYVDEDATQEISLENKQKRVDKLVEELFGDQSSLGGSTTTGETVIVPRNYGS